MTYIGDTPETESGFEIKNWWYGRVDAPDSPYYENSTINNDIGVWKDFPHPYFDDVDSHSFFNEKYGFNIRETVALIGMYLFPPYNPFCLVCDHGPMLIVKICIWCTFCIYL